MTRPYPKPIMSFSGVETNINSFIYPWWFWKRTSTTSMLTSNFLIDLSFSFQLIFQLRQKTQWAKCPLMGTKATTSSSKNCPQPGRPIWTDPETVIGLAFTVHLHVPTDLCRTFVLCKPTVFEVTGVVFSEINPFLVSPPLISLPLAFVWGKWSNLVCLGLPEPPTLALLCPTYIFTVFC